MNSNKSQWKPNTKELANDLVASKNSKLKSKSTQKHQTYKSFNLKNEMESSKSKTRSYDN